MYNNLQDADLYVLISLLHEMEHRFSPCAFQVLDKEHECPMYQRAVENSGKGYLTVIDNLIDGKLDKLAAMCPASP